MDHNPYSALSKLCFKYNCSPCDTRRVLEIMAAELENIGEEVERREEDQNKDYEEPKDNNYWYIDDFGRIQFSSEVLDEIAGQPNNWMARKLFGNYFETKEEAEKAVEKLRAWKRLKDKGFKFERPYTMHDHIKYDVDNITGELKVDRVLGEDREIRADLDLLFGGEEEDE